ncbi:MAG: hypothetical protein CHACPFDD_04113 [Phycisphaerae bacterium]|nr:hypothetical protein [Phycisphaerae bacterium]
MQLDVAAARRAAQRNVDILLTGVSRVSTGADDFLVKRGVGQYGRDLRIGLAAVAAARAEKRALGTVERKVSDVDVSGLIKRHGRVGARAACHSVLRHAERHERPGQAAVEREERVHGGEAGTMPADHHVERVGGVGGDADLGLITSQVADVDVARNERRWGRRLQQVERCRLDVQVVNVVDRRLDDLGRRDACHGARDEQQEAE